MIDVLPLSVFDNCFIKDVLTLFSFKSLINISPCLSSPTLPIKATGFPCFATEMDWFAPLPPGDSTTFSPKTVCPLAGNSSTYVTRSEEHTSELQSRGHLV